MFDIVPVGAIDIIAIFLNPCSFIANFVNNIIFLKASKIITISNSVKKFFLKDIFKANSNKFKLIYYGINKSYIRLLENKKLKRKVIKSFIPFIEQIGPDPYCNNRPLIVAFYSPRYK